MQIPKLKTFYSNDKNSRLRRSMVKVRMFPSRKMAGKDHVSFFAEFVGTK